MNQMLLQFNFYHDNYNYTFINGIAVNDIMISIIYHVNFSHNKNKLPYCSYVYEHTTNKLTFLSCVALICDRLTIYNIYKKLCDGSLLMYGLTYIHIDGRKFGNTLSTNQ